MPTRAPMPHDDLYRQLQRHLDQMPVPYPATESGVELRILRRLFSPEEARLALSLGMIPDRVAVIRKRAGNGSDVAALTRKLDDMASRGLVQRISSRRGPLYGKSVFVVGFYEAQVNRLTADLQRDVEQYFEEAFAPALHSKQSPQLRTVPINQSIPVERYVGTYDDIRAFVQASPGPFAVMNCICQQGKDLLDTPCKVSHDREHCLTFGSAAKSMVRHGNGRFISREDMLAFLERADLDGLVLEPQNTQDPLFICCCCGCCCGVLTTAKKFPKPAEFFAANYYAEVRADECTECGTCATRCQMEAITTDSGPMSVMVERCIGCGLCVTTCPSGAMHLLPKSDAAAPPKDTGRLYARMYRERFGTLGLAGAVGRRMLGLKS